jgi:aspartyl-tRNA(Asn)/glutamyl-tRNA(Gln) amidotransferase subunit A
VVPDYSSGIGASVAQFRLGMPAEFFDHLDEEIARAVDDAFTVLNKLTKGSHEVGLPSLLHAGVGAEMIAAHENVRGVNGGTFEPSTTRVFAANAESARAVDYIRGWRDLEIVRRSIDEDVFRKENVDLLIAPATRHMPPTIEQDLLPAAGGAGGRGGANAGEGGAGRGGAEGRGNAATRKVDLESNTRAFNGYGLPVVTVPCGFSKDGMPIGLQIAGPHFAEAQVLALAHAYQQATDWHRKRPPLTPETKVPVLSKLAAEQTGS